MASILNKSLSKYLNTFLSNTIVSKGKLPPKQFNCTTCTQRSSQTYDTQPNLNFQPYPLHALPHLLQYSRTAPTTSHIVTNSLHFTLTKKKTIVTNTLQLTNTNWTTKSRLQSRLRLNSIFGHRLASIISHGNNREGLSVAKESGQTRCLTPHGNLEASFFRNCFAKFVSNGRHFFARHLPNFSASVRVVARLLQEVRQRYFFNQNSNKTTKPVYSLSFYRWFGGEESKDTQTRDKESRLVFQNQIEVVRDPHQQEKAALIFFSSGALPLTLFSQAGVAIYLEKGFADHLIKTHQSTARETPIEFGATAVSLLENMTSDSVHDRILRRQLEQKEVLNLTRASVINNISAEKIIRIVPESRVDASAIAAKLETAVRSRLLTRNHTGFATEEILAKFRALFKGKIDPNTPLDIALLPSGICVFKNGKLQGKIICNLELGQSLLGSFLGDTAIAPRTRQNFIDQVIARSTELYKSSHLRFLINSYIYGDPNEDRNISDFSRYPIFQLPDWLEYERIHNTYGMMGERVLGEMKIQDKLSKSFMALNYLNGMTMRYMPEDPTPYKPLKSTRHLPAPGRMTPFDSPLDTLRPENDEDGLPESFAQWEYPTPKK